MGLLDSILGTVGQAKQGFQGLLADPLGTVGNYVQNNVAANNALASQVSNLYVDANGNPTFDQSKWSPAAVAANKNLTDAMAGTMMGATVWHGSPHVFDKFDASKIGTGEGAQVYGHGLYLAENPAVAKSYQQQLTSGTLVDKAGQPFVNSGEHDGALSYLRAMSGAPDPFASAIRAASHPANDAALHWTERDAAKQAIAQINELKSAGYQMQPGGALYKVDLPDEHIAKMLDWDRKLSEQPAVQSTLVKRGWQLDSNETGADLYGRFTGAEPGAASAAFRSAGIPGIRYQDGMSRSGSGGTSNFVVFPGNETLLNILERNGQPLK